MPHQSRQSGNAMGKKDNHFYSRDCFKDLNQVWSTRTLKMHTSQYFDFYLKTIPNNLRFSHMYNMIYSIWSVTFRHPRQKETEL